MQELSQHNHTQRKESLQLTSQPQQSNREQVTAGHRVSACSVLTAVSVQPWKSKYEALTSRLPQMFGLVVDEAYDSPVRAAQQGRADATVAARASPQRCPAGLGFGILELQVCSRVPLG